MRISELFVVMRQPVDECKLPEFWAGIGWDTNIQKALVYHYSFVPKGAEEGTPVSITFACYSLFKIIKSGCKNCVNGSCIKDHV